MLPLFAVGVIDVIGVPPVFRSAAGREASNSMDKINAKNRNLFSRRYNMLSALYSFANIFMQKITHRVI
jgi:hypothetical protein